MEVYKNEILTWLLDSDDTLKYQVYRDLLNEIKPELQEKIYENSWTAKILQKRQPNGHWGLSYYQPKWISTHYTLLELKNMAISINLPEITDSINLIIANEKGLDGGINPSGGTKYSDICINGMFLNFTSYFRADEKNLASIVDLIISQQMPDGGFNCQKNRQGAIHSSFHSTISVIEGINEYLKNGYSYKKAELKNILYDSVEFMLQHKLFKSDKTGLVINKKFTVFSYPCRWKYDVLRGLDFLCDANIAYDKLLDEAISLLISKRKENGTWNLGAIHPGKIHFEMEKLGRPSKWNTLRAMRVLKYYNIDV